jgi:hypothetical protein
VGCRALGIRMNWREEYAKSLMTLGNLALVGLFFNVLSTLVLLVIFVLVVNRLTREDHKRKDKA